MILDNGIRISDFVYSCPWSQLSYFSFLSSYAVCWKKRIEHSDTVIKTIIMSYYLLTLVTLCRDHNQLDVEQIQICYLQILQFQFVLTLTILIYSETNEQLSRAFILIVLRFERVNSSVVTCQNSGQGYGVTNSLWSFASGWTSDCSGWQIEWLA